MAKKKYQSSHVSQEDTVEAQHVFTQYHQIARKLHESASRTQVEAALAVISTLPEAVQMALLKLLSKEADTDVADILQAMNEVSLTKEVRKEAKRALIQLQGAKIFPQWRLPVEQPVAIEVASVDNSRFWNGSITDTRAAGEVQLLLTWETGDGYKDVRMIGFLLEFWSGGVVDCFIRVQSKRSFEKFIAQMKAEMSGVPFKDCSLAQGRRILLEALAVNQKQGTLPHRDYRLNLSLINQLVLDNSAIEEDENKSPYVLVEGELDGMGEESDFVSEDEDEDEEEPISLHDLSPDKVVTAFVSCSIEGKFDIAYELLASNSSLREGLSKEDWVDNRNAWLEESNPGNLEPNLLYEREPQKSKLWLPGVFRADKSSVNKVIEAGWSIEIDETPRSEMLPELPQAIAVYEETGRHWYWASFTLIQDEGEWRIQSMTDESKIALDRSAEELRTTIHEHFKSMGEIAKKYKSADNETFSHAEEMIQHLMLAASYSDVLIKKLPDDPVVLEEIVTYLFVFTLYERCLVYLEALTRRFTKNRAYHLEHKADVQRNLSEKYFEEEDVERGERFLELAEQTLTELLAISDTFAVRIALAEVLIERTERLEEAEEHLHRASTFTNDPTDESRIALHLGEIALEREQFEEALQHFQRVVDFEPDNVLAWVHRGDTYAKLGNLEEAEVSFRRAISLEPDNPDYYYAISAMYTELHQIDKAIEILEDGLSENPDSATMNLTLAMMYVENQDYRQAEIFFKQAERLDPDTPFLRSIQEIITLGMQVSSPTSPSLKQSSAPAPPKFSKQKKKRK